MNIGIGIGLCRLQGGGDGAPPTGDWLLITGFWDDAGVWDDSATWNDEV